VCRNTGIAGEVPPAAAAARRVQNTLDTEDAYTAGLDYAPTFALYPNVSIYLCVPSVRGVAVGVLGAGHAKKEAKLHSIIILWNAYSHASLVVSKIYN
jgi:hypothetical protein